jgi:hypothetical protein
MEENYLFVSKMCDYILENHKVSSTRRDKVTIDGISCSGSGSVTKFINLIIKHNKKTMLEVDSRLVTLEDKELRDFISLYLEPIEAELFSRISKKEIEEIYESQEIITKRNLVLSCIPVIKIDGSGSYGGEYFMIDKVTGKYNPKVAFSAWKNAVTENMVKEQKDTVKHIGDLIYDPENIFNFKDVLDDPRGEYTVFNSYNPPAWKLQNIEDQADLDPLYLKFFNTIFASERARQYVIDWVWASTQKMVPVYCCFIGAPGVGKNILAESVKSLHGEDNHESAKDSHLTDKFNNHLQNKTFVVYDEINLHVKNNAPTARARLKEWANSSVSIENKGKDSKTQKIYASCFIHTNYKTNLPIEFNDRKFSIIDLTNIKVENRGLSKDDIDYLRYEYIPKDPSFPGSFARFLYTNKSKNFNPHLPYKGEAFRDLVIVSLNGWQQSLRSILLSKESAQYDYSYLLEKIPYFPSLDKVADFLNNYREIRRSDNFEKDQNYLHNANENGMTLGYIKNLPKGSIIEVNPEIFNGSGKSNIDL